MVSTNFQKELEENKILDEFYTDEKEDDTVSIDSISEYEDEDQYDDEIIQIKNFKETQENKYNLKNNLPRLEMRNDAKLDTNLLPCYCYYNENFYTGINPPNCRPEFH